MNDSYFWKHLFQFRGFLIMKTTFSYFPGMFEFSSASEILFKKILWNMNYIRMSRKIIDDCCLQYLNDLFGIKLIFLRSELNVQTFWIYMDAKFFSMIRFFYNFLLIDATDRSRISSDQKRLFFAVRLHPYPFIFRDHSL